ncbi:MAG: hydrolase, partial [Gemmatimonadetes bacterium]|nr:hydrolase [Gemmatimonadota bacterium]NIU29347.1 hydrolase [Gemmatimonadota bacterium]NIV59763.1 hydrolase [Gemmatimonadota bacterium]NIW62414.1 hydrolase [Gemmatimonadota bacterium]NIX38670.1 hydrolase [Gemmatimonadota bacterium]
MYGVARVQRDFRDGRSAVGFIGTGVARDGGAAAALNLRSRALTGGLDFRHRFGGDRFQVSGYAVGSRVSGSRETIEATQRSSSRYFQRPDADHVRLDPERTSLDGWAGFLQTSKIGGGFWRFSTGAQLRSPG